MKALVPLAALFLATGTLAGEHRYGLAPTYVAECGTCHVAYPPGLMSAPAWSEILQGLDRHFGSDASLDQESYGKIAAILQRDASRRGKHQPGSKVPRLTQTPWFQKEHRPDKRAEYRLQPVASGSTPMAQCNTCHSRADRGDFDEDSLHSPRRHP